MGNEYILFSLLLMVASSVHAEDYHYMTFVMTDGAKVSVDVENLSVSVSGNKLVTGDKEFVVQNLQKMYFSVNNESATAINAVEANSESNCWEWTSTLNSSNLYIVKGGSWDSSRDACRTEYSDDARDGSKGYSNVGFRVVRVDK